MADLSLRAALARLSAALDEGGALWRSRPFVEEPAWAATHPEVVAWCERRHPAEVAAIEQADRLPDDAPEILRDWQRRLAAATEIPRWSLSALLTLSTRRSPERLVPARKAGQIAAFAEALARGASGLAPAAVLDWCGGKGHLGRILAGRFDVPVTVLERESRFAPAAHSLASAAGVALTFERGDALAAPAGLFGPGVLAVGLHACGELGTRLLERAVSDGVHAVALSPCCLHKVQRATGFAPLSAAGRAFDPRFDHASLRLATADEVVARPRLRHGRRRENAFRLGFDRLARAAGREGYTPLGTLPPEVFADGFASFARTVAARHAIPLPPRWDPQLAESIGWREADRARALGLVRCLFKRAIEVWCALDRAVFLEERGLDAQIGEFAPRAVTPRNLLIVGR